MTTTESTEATGGAAWGSTGNDEATARPEELKARRFALPGFDVHVGPAAHLAAERDRLDRLTWEHFDVTRLGATIGAVLHGPDLTTDLPEPVIADIRQALAEYKVVFFRDQPMTSDQHVAFARRFGDLEVHAFLGANKDNRELVRFEKSADVAGYENAWHHDVTWREVPSMGAILHGIEVPDVGGDTLFADMYAAYAGLPDDVKQRIDGLDLEHTFVKTFGAFLDAEQRAKMLEQYPPPTHPMVCTHDVTGRKHLYANRNFASHVVGMDRDESRALIDLVCRQADYPEYQCRFRWEPHSVAFWDNRAVQHYASSDYWPRVRIMERASIIGTRPHR
ncbi:MAG: TauD/TfdA dioxygenase family protein [Aquihabitans sp.]